VTIPNLLSLFRMGLTPLFLVAVVSGRPVEALLVFALAGITDALDGFIARHFGQQSRLGAYLDPAADKLLLTSAYVVLAIPGVHAGALIPAWVTVLVIARDVIIVIVTLTLALALSMGGFQPSWLSKVNTSVQVVTAIGVLASGIWPALVPLAEWAVWAVVATTLASGVDYLVRSHWMAGADRK
jgi:cardiolipin synthase